MVEEDSEPGTYPDKRIPIVKAVFTPRLAIRRAEGIENIRTITINAEENQAKVVLDKLYSLNQKEDLPSELEKI